MNSRLDAVLKTIGSIRPRWVAAHRGAKAPRRSIDDTPQRSTLAIGVEGTQGTTLPLFGTSPLSSLSREVGRDFREVMMEQVEANVAQLMVGQVPPAFKDLATITIIVAYLRFKKDLSGLPSKGVLEHTIDKSVKVTCFINLLSFTLSSLFFK